MKYTIFLLIFVMAVLIGGSALYYLWNRFTHFEWLKDLPERRKRLIALIPVAALAVWWIRSLNGMVVILHLAVAWSLCDLAARFWRKPMKRYYAGYAAILLAALYLAYGYAACHRVTRTHYSLTTNKALPANGLRIALFADSHLGTVFDGDGMAERLDLIDRENPDVLVMAGDLVDDGTTRKDAERMAKALAEFSAPLGKYFVFGNHDKGYYDKRDFSADEFVEMLEKAGVRVLRDEVAELGSFAAIIGRRDCSEKKRKSAAEVIAPVAPERYRIELDHQPNDYAAEAAAGADLVLSGHTHGGQLFPLGFISRWSANDRCHGWERRGNTDFIVTSGIADWGIDFKTGCQSEYVIIDVKHAD